MTVDEELVARMHGASAYLKDRVGLKMTLDRDQEELLVADLSTAATRIEQLLNSEERMRSALNEIRREVAADLPNDASEYRVYRVRNSLLTKAEHALSGRFAPEQTVNVKTNVKTG